MSDSLAKREGAGGLEMESYSRTLRLLFKILYRGEKIYIEKNFDPISLLKGTYHFEAVYEEIAFYF